MLHCFVEKTPVEVILSQDCMGVKAELFSIAMLPVKAMPPDWTIAGASQGP